VKIFAIEAVGLRKSYRQVASALNVDTRRQQNHKYPSNVENTKLTDFAKVFRS